jgi:hypothetical protein
VVFFATTRGAFRIIPPWYFLHGALLGLLAFFLGECFSASAALAILC